MCLSLLLNLAGYFLNNTLTADLENPCDERFAQTIIDEVNEETLLLRNRLVRASWAYETNISDVNLKNKLETSSFVAERQKINWKRLNKCNWQDYEDPVLRRQFKFYSTIGSFALPEEKLKHLEEAKSEMKKIYSTAEVCIDNENKDCGYTLEPGLYRKFANTRDPEKLKIMWVNWRNAVGPLVKERFQEYVRLANEAARLNSYKHNGEYWLDAYEDKNFRITLRDLWKELKPLYLQLHAFVRHRLRQKYGDIVSRTGPIPAHLFGNMWAQSWGAISDITLPYPDEKLPDLNKELLNQGYTQETIFKKAEDFFVSINLTAMPESFWELSVLKKPTDRNIVCHASAWDFFDGTDVRIKQCTEVNLGYFVTTHHEMGHVQYYLLYNHLPVMFRRGANPGFHEAVGDTITLSVRSFKHLRSQGLMKSEENERILLNNLFSVGLDKIAFLPFAYIMDLWRWGIFSGTTKPENYNCEWWKLSEEYQGIEPPVDRSEYDFDAASKYHVVGDVPYIRYFVSFILQFQFHRALCIKANQYIPYAPITPLYNCDIYGNTDAGNAFKRMLSLGRSVPWHDALETLTGERNLNASGLLEYFQPLYYWLKTENQKNGAYIGWTKSTKKCHSHIHET